MRTKTRVSTLLSPLKACVLLALATLTFNAFADGGMYLDNPIRPDTIWVPGHCMNGCWNDGRYFKLLTPVTSDEVTWIPGQYDNNGNWITGHWQLHNYVVVNPGPDSYYPGWAM